MDFVSVDKDRKVAITDTGREIPLSDDTLKDFYKGAGRSESFTKQKKQAKKSHESFAGALGKVSEMEQSSQGGIKDWSGLEGLSEKAGNLFVAGFTGMRKGEGQEDMSYRERVGEDLAAHNEGVEESRQNLYNEYPKSKIAGNVGGIATDLAFGKSMPAVGAIAAPIYGAGLDKTNIVESPGKWVSNRIIDAGAGYIIDKGVGKLSRVASEIAKKRLYDAEAKAIEAAKRALPAQQLQARRVASKKITDAIGKLGTEMSTSTISRDALEVQTIVNETINASEIAGSPEATSLKKFFTSLIESRPEKMGWKDISKTINAIEDKIIVSEEKVIPLIVSFKDQLLEKIPQAVGEASSKRKYGTRILNSVLKDVRRETKNLLKSDNVKNHVSSVLGERGESMLLNSVETEIRTFFNEVSDKEFSYLVNSGELGNTIENIINNSKTVSNLAKEFEKGMPEWFIKEVSGRDFEKFSSGIADSISSSTESFATDLFVESNHTQSEVSRRLKKAAGAAEALPVPQDLPEREAMGFLANLSEKPFSGMLPKKNITSGVGAGLIGGAGAALGVAKLPAIAATVGGGAAIGAGGLGALKMATSPTKLGDITRKGISYFGKVLPSWLQNNFDSYEDGVLTNPEDRLEASIEIEKDPNLGNQDKAIWQTMINKGQRIK